MKEFEKLLEIKKQLKHSREFLINRNGTAKEISSIDGQIMAIKLYLNSTY